MKKTVSFMLAALTVIGGLTACNANGNNIKPRTSGNSETNIQAEGPHTASGSAADVTSAQDPVSEPDNVTTLYSPDAPSAIGIWESFIQERLFTPGLWSIPESTELTPDLQKIFDGIKGDIGDDDYTPVALINIQKSTADDSCNYCFLCKGVPESKDDYWCLVYVHDDGNGGSEFCNVFNIDLEQAFRSDIENTYLPDEENDLDVWHHTDTIDVPSNILKAYNDATINDITYNMVLGYLGTTEDGRHCLITTNSLYLNSNNGLMLTYIRNIDGKKWGVVETTSIDMKSECPPPSMDAEYKRGNNLFYTYGGWSIPSNMDILGLPQEVVLLLENEGLTPSAVISYKEYLHPDHKLLLRVVLCREGDGAVLAFVEEDQDGVLDIADIYPIDIDLAVDNKAVTRADSANSGDWTVSDTGYIPEELSKYYESTLTENGFMDFQKPEYLIATKADGDNTEYLYVARRGLFRYQYNDSIVLVKTTLDKDGKGASSDVVISVDLNSMYSTIRKSGKAQGDPASEDSILSTVYEVTLKEDEALAAALMDEANHKDNERHANVGGIDLVVIDHKNEKAARSSFESSCEAFKEWTKYTADNYIFFDNIADSGLFGYVFVSGHEQVFILTSDIMNVTRAANIGDELAKKLF